jgi:hypothetical protein
MILYIMCKIWGLHGGDYDMETQNVPHRKYVTSSATMPGWLMLCKIWRFHGSDYEERRLLEYKNPVRTSQEAHICYRAQPVNAM